MQIIHKINLPVFLGSLAEGEFFYYPFTAGSIFKVEKNEKKASLICEHGHGSVDSFDINHRNKFDLVIVLTQDKLEVHKNHTQYKNS